MHWLPVEAIGNTTVRSLLTKREQQPKEKKKKQQTHPPPKNPQPNLLIEAFTSISSVHIKTLGSAELLKTLGHC